MNDAYPLQWPAHWPRTEKPQRSSFKTPLAAAREELKTELRRLKATNVVISTNIIVNQDGTYRSKQRIPDDRGVAVYFNLAGEAQCFPCDRWLQVEDNLHAVALSIHAIRGLERWGAQEMVNAAFRGFKALPAQTIVTPYQARLWYDVLEVSPTASPQIIKAAYRQQLLKHHPDQGGELAAFNEVQKAYREATS
ncbi:J domain-containing protein [Paeniglutamicibacter sp. ABSL32-1]|uniref:J domain-containing protein n=1 Tax=Paeniglutamicibacter quisquiliarum TaxID=2849498 RepID=UPI001C2CCCE3|nr:J domain-containing protein [Paeniglutamicibacter quisquiliarum]MBV1778714.1 J domain-containing protein [Paeniglutamicibacter quisquiliarum]